MTPISLWASLKSKRSMVPGTHLDVATKARITKQLSGYIQEIRYLGESNYI
jgi:calcineurin-like phosphoesterase